MRHQQKPPARGQQQVLKIYQTVQRSRARLIGADGKPRILPATLHGFLVKLADGLSEGRSIAIVQNDPQLTTVEAARILGVSRQFLIKVLDRGVIRYHMVGSHRRIYVRDLLAYKAQRDSTRRQILDDLTRAEAADGLYDLEPSHDRAR